MASLPAPHTIRSERFDSPLGSWLLASWAPPDLAHIVETMWYFDGRLTHRRERIFPHCGLELIIHLGDVYREVDAHGATAYSIACVTGQLLESIVIEAPPARSCVLGIRLRPAGAFALFGRPVHDLTGNTVDLNDVARGAAAELADRCTAAADAVARLRIAAEWMRTRMTPDRHPDAAVEWATARIRQTHGRIPIARLQEKTGWSKTRFTSTFREQVGVPPKVLARIARFQHALGQVRVNARPLADIAHACGYYDQAHLNAEFRAFCGFSPGEYRTSLHYPNSPSLADS
jgi:AraC-like DNA-binding protein